MNEQPHLSIRQQYENCYRIERLIQQSIAVFDQESQIELTEELFTYCSQARGAAYDSLMNGMGALRNGEFDIRVAMAWCERYRRSQAVVR